MINLFKRATSTFGCENSAVIPLACVHFNVALCVVLCPIAIIIFGGCRGCVPIISNNPTRITLPFLATSEKAYKPNCKNYFSHCIDFNTQNYTQIH